MESWDFGETVIPRRVDAVEGYNRHIEYRNKEGGISGSKSDATIINDFIFRLVDGF
jgi:hypothetical protein